MQAILYIAHGSRVKAGVEQAVNFLKSVQQEIEIPIQEISFLELATPTIAEGIASCINQGATAIAIVPILLLAAQHAKHDIPSEIDKAEKQHPQVRFTYGEPLGVHELLIDTLQNRILEVGCPIKDASVLVIGRGSSDPAVKRDLDKIATRLRDKYDYEAVDTCFLYGMGPTFEEWLQQENKDNQVFIVPYLLFTGVLRQNITKRLQDYENKNVILCESLGYDDNVRKVLVERIYQLIKFTKKGVL
ncbi:sirohydrochlorin chelatase [Lysinibacillus xylanilyticus]|uniref:sirohydrochlorin chelatase n=1 Tax=Lysinibacillus xylanilyticus TaxID=582475 RepID=UPI00380E23B8